MRNAGKSHRTQHSAPEVVFGGRKIESGAYHMQWICNSTRRAVHVLQHAAQAATENNYITVIQFIIENHYKRLFLRQRRHGSVAARAQVISRLSAHLPAAARRNERG
jgi:hypothetical protein